MALVIVTGLPCSGRTTRAREVHAAFEARLHEVPSLSRVVRVCDDDVHVDKSVFDCTCEPYAAQRTEKGARAAYLSAVRRALGHNAIVIADGGAGMNIKGYRYELWCAARELGIRCATVGAALTQMHVACAPELPRAWNAARIAEGRADAYSPTGCVCGTDAGWTSSWRASRSRRLRRGGTGRCSS